MSRKKRVRRRLGALTGAMIDAALGAEVVFGDSDKVGGTD